MESFKNFLLVVAAVVIATITAFGLIKLGGAMFDVPTQGSITDRNANRCWARGGTPVMDTRGEDDDFKTCKYK